MANEKAKAFLKQYIKTARMLDNKKIERQMWEDVSLSTTATLGGERVQTSGNPDRMSNASDNKIDVEKEIDETIEKLAHIQKDILSVIETLPVNEYDVLHKCYIRGMTNVEIADLAGKESSWASANKFKGETKVQQILEAREADEADIC